MHLQRQSFAGTLDCENCDPIPRIHDGKACRFLIGEKRTVIIYCQVKVMHKRMIVENRITARVQILGAITLAATVFIGAMAGEAQAQPPNANDTARLLAGMQPAPGSSLLALTKERTWQQHANRLNALFAQVENPQLARIRSWSRAKVRHQARYCSICSAGRTSSTLMPSFRIAPPT